MQECHWPSPMVKWRSHYRVVRRKRNELTYYVQRRVTSEGRSGEERCVRREENVSSLLTRRSSPDRPSPVARRRWKAPHPSPVAVGNPSRLARPRSETAPPIPSVKAVVPPLSTL